MAIYKRLTCVCGYGTTATKEGKVQHCQKCGNSMQFSHNWYISYTHAGKTTRKSISPRKKDAQEALAKATTNIAEGKAGLNKIKPVRFSVLMEKFLKKYEDQETNTHRTYLNALRWFQFNDLFLLDITPALIEERVSQGLSGGKSKTSLNSYVGVLITAFNYAVKCGMLHTNHIKIADKPKAAPSRDRVLTSSEIESLLTEIKNGDYEWYLYSAVMIALNTGLRKIDVLRLKWENVDIKNRAFVNVNIKKSKKVIKYLPMTEELVGALTELRFSKKTVGISGYIFHQKRNHNKHISPDNLNGFNEAVAECSISDFTFHDLRHCFASHFLAQGGTPEVLMTILAHSKIDMTMRYVQVFKEYVKDQMDSFKISN